MSGPSVRTRTPLALLYVQPARTRRTRRRQAGHQHSPPIHAQRGSRTGSGAALTASLCCSHVTLEGAILRARQAAGALDIQATALTLTQTPQSAQKRGRACSSAATMASP